MYQTGFLRLQYPKIRWSLGPVATTHVRGWKQLVLHLDPVFTHGIPFANVTDGDFLPGSGHKMVTCHFLFDSHFESLSVLFGIKNLPRTDINTLG